MLVVPVETSEIVLTENGFPLNNQETICVVGFEKVCEVTSLGRLVRRQGLAMTLEMPDVSGPGHHDSVQGRTGVAKRPAIKRGGQVVGFGNLALGTGWKTLHDRRVCGT